MKDVHPVGFAHGFPTQESPLFSIMSLQIPLTFKI